MKFLGFEMLHKVQKTQCLLKFLKITEIEIGYVKTPDRTRTKIRLDIQTVSRYEFIVLSSISLNMVKTVRYVLLQLM